MSLRTIFQMVLERYSERARQASLDHGIYESVATLASLQRAAYEEKPDLLYTSHGLLDGTEDQLYWSFYSVVKERLIKRGWPLIQGDGGDREYTHDEVDLNHGINVALEVMMAVAPKSEAHVRMYLNDKAPMLERQLGVAYIRAHAQELAAVAAEMKSFTYADVRPQHTYILYGLPPGSSPPPQP